MKNQRKYVHTARQKSMELELSLKRLNLRFERESTAANDTIRELRERLEKARDRISKLEEEAIETDSLKSLCNFLKQRVEDNDRATDDLKVVAEMLARCLGWLERARNYPLYQIQKEET